MPKAPQLADVLAARILNGPRPEFWPLEEYQMLLGFEPGRWMRTPDGHTRVPTETIWGRLALHPSGYRIRLPPGHPPAR